VSAVVGVFTVIRGQSFAGHSLGDLGTTGGSGAYLVGVNPLWGFVTFAILGSSAMELFGARRSRTRDMATGIVLGAGLGVAALFLYLCTQERNTTGATITILFGSMFAIRSSMIPIFVLLGLLALAIVGLFYRPLLLSTLNRDVAFARGVPVAALEVLYMVAMAIGVSLSCVTIGAILSTALLIGPAAAALRLTKRPGTAIACASGIALLVTWLGILLALILGAYLVADLFSRRASRRAGRPQGVSRPGLASRAAESGDEPLGAR
jgi:zinc/manganese transport system permease protein